MTIPQTMIDEQINGGNLSVSGTFSGPGGASFQGVRLLNTGVNNMIATTSTLDDTQIAEYMSATELQTLSFPLFAYAKLGEAAYPSLVDTMGNLQGGVFSGGTAADYKNMPI